MKHCTRCHHLQEQMWHNRPSGSCVHQGGGCLVAWCPTSCQVSQVPPKSPGAGPVSVIHLCRHSPAHIVLCTTIQGNWMYNRAECGCQPNHGHNATFVLSWWVLKVVKKSCFKVHFLMIYLYIFHWSAKQWHIFLGFSKVADVSLGFSRDKRWWWPTTGRCL